MDLHMNEWVKLLSRVQLFPIPWTVTYQAPPSMEFSRQEYWSGLPFPSPGDLPNPGIEPRSPALQADTLPSEPPGKPRRYRFSRQEHWSGLPFPSPGDLPHPGIKPKSPALQADALPSELLGKPWAKGLILLIYKQLSQISNYKLNKSKKHGKEIGDSQKKKHICVCCCC